jgi:hypothetical protein
MVRSGKVIILSISVTNLNQVLKRLLQGDRGD